MLKSFTRLSVSASRRIVISRSYTRKKTLDDIVKPQPIEVRPSSAGVGHEITGVSLERKDLNRILMEFRNRPLLQELSKEHGITEKIEAQAFRSFRTMCVAGSNPLPIELHVVFSDILQGSGHVDDLFPHFLDYAKRLYPHLECLQELKHISNLTQPHEWYPEARSFLRKIVFHAGPTNSGKTYNALERYMASKSGVYCGPLKLLASEVFYKTNSAGVNCDLVTGEERKFAMDREHPSPHVSCTVEMVNTQQHYEVAIIDEIQMMRDLQRGWAWTRALLGVSAEEVHVCGEAAAIDLVRQMVEPLGEEFEVNTYKRMTPLTVLNQAVGSFDRVKAGDCIVCFNKKHIFAVSRMVEKAGHEVAVIYGSLPPNTKLSQAERFNNPQDHCHVLVATDAIGMGLNLSIKRIIFYSLMKPNLLESGEKEMSYISTSQALQIGGRAGRFGTEYENGEVTTFLQEDLTKLVYILKQPVETTNKAGLFPTFEQIEMFSYHLPKATLSDIFDIFVSVCNVDDSKYFMCNVTEIIELTKMIEHIPLPLKVRYVFCLAPISRQLPLVCTHFVRFARRYSTGQPLTFSWLCDLIGWPLTNSETLADLVNMEQIFDICDLYLWLGMRFPDMFPNQEDIRDMQTELDKMIQKGVESITALLRKQETNYSTGIAQNDPDHDDYSRKRRSNPNKNVDKEETPKTQRNPKILKLGKKRRR